MRTCCITQGTLLHFAVQQKLVQHCKTTIPQLKKKKKERNTGEGEPQNAADEETEGYTEYEGPWWTAYIRYIHVYMYVVLFNNQPTF